MTRPGPLANCWWAKPLARPAALLWGIVTDAVVARRDARRRHLPLPTISVGNLVVGGTGKSPITRWVVGELQRLGAHPMIITTGYGRRRGEAGDEAIEHREACPGVIVAEGRDRNAAAQRGIAEAKARGVRVDCIVLDDGFQRCDVARDIDIVVLRGDEGSDARLPLGWLRETPAALKRATHVACWGEAEQATRRMLAAVAEGRPSAVFDRSWSGVRVSQGEATRDEPLTWLEGKRVEVWLGLGNAAPFLDAARSAGATIGAICLRRDHAVYTPRWIARRVALPSLRAVDAVITSEKDWVKVRSALRNVPAASNLVVVRPRLAVSLRADAGAASLQGALAMFAQRVLA